MPSTEASKRILETLPPCGQVWPIFLDLVETPRPSTYHDKVIAMLSKWCDDHHFEYEIDESFNFLIRAPATPGCEDKPIVCLQGHSDIVAQKDEGVEINFKEDPLVPRIIEKDGKKYLMATGTSLGSDDGIGVAMALSCLVDPDVKHGPLEILITSDEEIGLIGASALKKDWLKARTLLNIDSEDEGILTISSAGGFRVVWTLPCDPQPLGEKMTKVVLKFKQFRGGHSGADIMCPVMNAVIAGARVLVSAIHKHGLEGKVHLVSANGGTAHNAIPRDSEYQVAVSPKDLTALKEAVKAEFEKMRPALKVSDPDSTLVIAESGEIEEALSFEATSKTLDFIFNIPHGVMRMSPYVEGQVETSIAATVLETHEEEHTITLLAAGRSNDDGELSALYDRCMAYGRGFGFKTSEKLNSYPGWPADPDAKIIKIMADCYRELMGKEAKIEAIHAGLESGMIIGSVSGKMEAISFGPTLKNPHSPMETLYIETVEPTYKLLAATLAKLAE